MAIGARRMLRLQISAARVPLAPARAHRRPNTRIGRTDRFRPPRRPPARPGAPESFIRSRSRGRHGAAETRAVAQAKRANNRSHTGPALGYFERGIHPWV